MNTETFNFSHIVTDIFRNGTINNIKANPELLGFIVGAIDNGFTVKSNGFMPMAQKGKVQIILRFDRDSNDLNLVIFKGKEKQGEFSYGLSGFLWMNVDVSKGTFHHKNILICSFK